MKINLNKFALFITASCLSISVYASDSHYVPGIEGVKESVVPPSDVYYKGYVVSYKADGKEALPPDSEVSVTALASRAVWATPQKLLGGHLALKAIVPSLQTDLKAGGQNVDKRTGLGDLYVGSVLGWHGDRGDAVTGIGY